MVAADNLSPQEAGAAADARADETTNVDEMRRMFDEY